MIYLKKVVEEDVDTIFYMANDEMARKYAFHPEKIPYDDHVKWFNAKLQEENTYMFLCKKNEVCIGQVRIEFADGIGEISYTIDAKYRGNGYGKKMLSLLESEMKKISNPNNIIFTGKVMENNIPSRKVFISLGYREEKKHNFFEYTKIV